MEKPRYEHDCNHCVYLGHFDNYDLYVCPEHNTKTISTVIARYGIDGDYLSGVTCIYRYEWATQAYARAMMMGYSLNKDDQEYVDNNIDHEEDTKTEQIIDEYLDIVANLTKAEMQQAIDMENEKQQSHADDNMNPYE